MNIDVRNNLQEDLEINTLEILKNLKDFKDKPKIIKEGNIDPNFILSYLPANYHRASIERLINLSSCKPDKDIGDDLIELNNILPYFCYAAGVVYISYTNKLTEKEIYSESEGSARFIEFISTLGSFVNIKNAPNNLFLNGLPRSGAEGLYGILAKDNISQIFFYINTLMQYSESPTEDSVKRIKNYIKDLNVVIVWNENPSSILTESLLKKINDKVVILLTPLENDYCYVKMHFVY